MARKKGTYPSETPEARRARGKAAVTVSLTLEALAALDALAAAKGTTRSAALNDLLLELDASPSVIQNGVPNARSPG